MVGIVDFQYAANTTTSVCVLYYSSYIIAKHNYIMHMEISLHCNIIIYRYTEVQLQNAIAHYKLQLY